jgi:hypothetical protein
MSGFPYRPRAPRVPPEAPEPDPPGVQDRKFLVRMLVLVALVLWFGLRMAARVAVSAGAPQWMVYGQAFGDGLYWMGLAALLLPWLSRNSIYGKYFRESFFEALTIFLGVGLMVVFLVILWFTFAHVPGLRS